MTIVAVGILAGALAGGFADGPTAGAADARLSPGSAPVASQAPSAACRISAVASHGGWWYEIGGDEAFFHALPDDRYAAGPWPYLITTRFHPDAPAGARVRIWADLLGSGGRVEGAFNSRQDPRRIYRGAERAPQLPGGWYLFEQRLPVAGCWRLSAAIDGRVVGSAVMSVANGDSDYLPRATFVTEDATPGAPCFAFDTTGYSRAEATTVQAWWWDEGATATCHTRTSDIVRSEARIEPRVGGGYDFVLSIPLMGDGTDEIRVSLHASEATLGGVAVSDGNLSIFFRQVTTVDPALEPVGSACHPTRPTPAFTPPPPFPVEPPARYDSEWYGTAGLWTMLDRDGEVWSGLPRHDGRFGQKTFWWSADWPAVKEPEPQITVTGRRLDAPGRFEERGPGTNATADFGTAMLVGVEIPSAGCWELTARYRGAQLSYVVLVAE